MSLHRPTDRGAVISAKLNWHFTNNNPPRGIGAYIEARSSSSAFRPLNGPTELLPDELATLLPTPPNASLLLDAQRLLQEVGSAWPGPPSRTLPNASPARKL